MQFNLAVLQLMQIEGAGTALTDTDFTQPLGLLETLREHPALAMRILFFPGLAEALGIRDELPEIIRRVHPDIAEELLAALSRTEAFLFGLSLALPTGKTEATALPVPNIFLADDPTLPKKLLNTLSRNNITMLRQLLEQEPSKLRKLRGIGELYYRDLQKYVGRHGFALGVLCGRSIQ